MLILTTLPISTIRANSKQALAKRTKYLVSPFTDVTAVYSRSRRTQTRSLATVTSDPTLLPRKTSGRSRLNSRPKLSPDHPRHWNRPIALGVLPAYDEALKVIRADSFRLKTEKVALQVQLNDAEQKSVEEDILEVMRERITILEVQSEVNLPEVRWKCANGMADMSRAVDRHLVEQRWRTEGGLDLLMERIYQMNVVPDVLPSLKPTLDLRITFPTPPPRSAYLRQNMKRKYADVEPGVFLLPEQTRDPPKIFANVFHHDQRLYTLLMIDPDVPDEENQCFQTYLHWLKPNISLSAISPKRILVDDSHTQYIPPHPQRGTPYHRYILLLLPQPLPGEELLLSPIAESSRRGFNLRQFMEQHGLDGAIGGGAHMWRGVWNEEVSRIYKDVLEVQEPQFGRPKKQDPYAEVKRLHRYI